MTFAILTGMQLLAHRTTLLIADFRAPMLWGTRRAFRSVAAAEQLALVGWRAIGEGGRVGLMSLGGAEPTFVPARGRERAMVAVVGGLVKAHRMALDQQVETPQLKPQPLDECLRMIRQIAPRGASVVLASSLDEPGDDWERAATALGHRVALSVLHLRDAFEQSPKAGAYPFDVKSVISVASRLSELGIPVHEVDASQAPDRFVGKG